MRMVTKLAAASNLGGQNPMHWPKPWPVMELVALLSLRIRFSLMVLPPTSACPLLATIVDRPLTGPPALAGDVGLRTMCAEGAGSPGRSGPPASRALKAVADRGGLR
jgi:hypothetical protein